MRHDTCPRRQICSGHIANACEGCKASKQIRLKRYVKQIFLDLDQEEMRRAYGFSTHSAEDIVLEVLIKLATDIKENPDAMINPYNY